MAQHFKDLVAWQKAMDMVTEIYTAYRQLSEAGSLQPYRSDSPRGRFSSQQHR